MKTPFLERLLFSRKTRLAKLKQQVITYLDSHLSGNYQKEYSEVIEYLKHNEISVFPYPSLNAFKDSDVIVELDNDHKLFYSIINGKKLYYKNGSQKKKALRYFKSIIIEQDKNSPHCYLSNDFQVSNDDIVLDVGAAEGNFSLSIIDRAKHVYLFEPDSRWNKALEATFKPWRNKITIVNKYVSDRSDESKNIICLDDFIKNVKINFIKADVEGFEMNLLNGSLRTIKDSSKLKIAICTYHNQDDADKIEHLLNDLNFQCSFTPGYMLYYYGKSNIVKEPYLRRGVLRAIRGNDD